MQDDLITKLNGLISDVNSSEILSHIEDDTLSDWLDAWKMEMAAVSMGLFTTINSRERELDRLRNFEETIYKLLKGGIQE